MMLHLPKLYYGPAFQAAAEDRHTLRLDPAPRGLKGLRILFITDIHASRRMFPPECARRLIDQAAALKADLLIYGGDFAESWDDLNWLLPMLDRLTPRLGAYTVLGNNDYEAMREKGEDHPLKELLAAHGIMPLVDEETAVSAGDGVIRIAGLDCALERTEPPREPFFQSSGDDELRILIAHYPWHLLPAEEWCARAPRLGLSGHTHGGQLKLFGLTPYSLGYELRQVSRSVTLSGWTDAPGYPTLVSPGIGTSKLPIRVNCEPTIHLITVE